jgi:Fe-S-cluster-containing dehydrogenase component
MNKLQHCHGKDSRIVSSTLSSTNRREFLRQSLLAIGAAATAGAITKSMGAVVNPGAQAQTSGSSSTTPALTPDGKLIQVESNSMRHVHVGRAVSDPEVRIGMPDRKWVMVIDLSKCDGCKSCTVACTKAHDTPVDREWIRVFKMQEGKDTPPYFFPRPCFHCDNPPCTKVCPVNATFKRQDGIVLVDNERCIGCRFCIAACPYSVRYFNWGPPKNSPEGLKIGYSPERGYPRRVGTVEKCDFCPEMLEMGELPHCASGCPMGAIYFGDQLEDAVTNSKGETERLSKLLKDRAGYRFMEELGTEPRTFYLPPKNRMYPAPGEPAQT